MPLAGDGLCISVYFFVDAGHREFLAGFKPAMAALVRLVYALRVYEYGCSMGHRELMFLSLY